MVLGAPARTPSPKVGRLETGQVGVFQSVVLCIYGKREGVTRQYDS